MSEASIERLSERERACLEHVRQAQELGLSFSEYCRQKDLKFNQWYWIKRGLMRKGVIAGPAKARKAGVSKPKPKIPGFAPVRIAPQASEVTACRVRHPSGWVIECASYPPAQWLSALVSGAPA